MDMDKGAIAFIALGLFLAGGVISFIKQKLPTGVIVLLGLGAVMSLGAGLMRL
ncbi:hypothetical protein [Wenjunlia tyrosinilytica]|uniref:Amidotransferase n=1 Tax=Wenjunlia tyrosinilytica TaxID=1544741 RepID=A0A917ZET9_9ACTN|nr:hypothetical protein [Wenjunlia tyrosinilytica]GGO81670.1 hypothetical protein GCM10012280_06490 [Wenjunlia tyrosinilytica]